MGFGVEVACVAAHPWENIYAVGAYGRPLPVLLCVYSALLDKSKGSLPPRGRPITERMNLDRNAADDSLNRTDPRKLGDNPSPFYRSDVHDGAESIATERDESGMDKSPFESSALRGRGDREDSSPERGPLEGSFGALGPQRTSRYAELSALLKGVRTTVTSNEAKPSQPGRPPLGRKAARDSDEDSGPFRRDREGSPARGRSPIVSPRPTEDSPFARSKGKMSPPATRRASLHSGDPFAD